MHVVMYVYSNVVWHGYYVLMVIEKEGIQKCILRIYTSDALSNQ